jgi:hypothetical protein
VARGRAFNIQEGALRARYRNGFDRPTPLVQGEATTLAVDMRAIAYCAPAGTPLAARHHQQQLSRASERNLNSGGDNAHETQAVRARNRVLHGGETLSWIELPVLPAAAPPTRRRRRARRCRVRRQGLNPVAYGAEHLGLRFERRHRVVDVGHEVVADVLEELRVAERVAQLAPRSCGPRGKLPE